MYNYLGKIEELTNSREMVLKQAKEAGYEDIKEFLFSTRFTNPKNGNYISIFGNGDVYGGRA